MLVTNTQALGTEYISELVDHGSRMCGLGCDKVEPETLLRPVAKAIEWKGKTKVAAPVQTRAGDAEAVEEVTCGRGRKSPHGRAVKKSDTGDAAAVNKEMMQALRQSPDIIAKVGNSYKKGLKSLQELKCSRSY